jgi:hypothetical protein
VDEFLAGADDAVVSAILIQIDFGRRLLEVVFSILDVVASQDLSISMALVLFIFEEINSFQ